MKIAFRRVVGHVPFDFNQIQEISVGPLIGAGLTWERKLLGRWAMAACCPSRPAMSRRVAPDGPCTGWSVVVVARTSPSDDNTAVADGIRCLPDAAERCDLVVMHHHALQTDELWLVIGDNTAYAHHTAGYNGIWQITSTHDRDPLFVPRYCGMNFEFIAPMAQGNPTEPKGHPTQLIVDEDAAQVTLHQTPTPTHHVESWMTYRTAGPAHVDWTFRYQLHDVARFDTGMAGFFFASYIHQPENKSIYVLSRDVYDALMWVQFCTTHQGRDSAVTWDADPYDLTFGA